MPIQETHTAEREVNFMVNPEAIYVSAVQYAANQIPFKVVKSQKIHKSEVGMRVIHSILAPKGTDVEVIKQCLGEDIQATFKSDASLESASGVSFVQHAREAFKDDSFEIVELDAEHKIKAIVGIPKDEEKSGLLGKLFKQKSEVIVLDDEVGPIPAETVTKMMSWETWDEMDALWAAISGILNQTEGDAKSKLKAVQGIWKNFTSFLDNVLSVTKGEAFLPTKREVEAEPKTEDVKETVVEEKTEDVVASTEPKVEQKEEATTPAEAVVEEAKAEDGGKAALEATITELKTLVLGLASKFEDMGKEVTKMQSLVPGVVVDKTEDAPVATKEKTAAEKGDFTGALFGNVR